MTEKGSIVITELRVWASQKFTGFRAVIEGASLIEESDLRIPGYAVADIVVGEQTEILAIADEVVSRSENWCRIELACALSSFHQAEVDSGVVPA